MPTPVISWEQEVIRLLELIASSNSVGSTTVSVTWSVPVNDTVTDTVADILSADPNRKALRICNLDQNNWIYLNINANASSTSAMYIISPGVTLLLDNESAGRISAIASAGTINITYMIGT